MDDNEKLIEAAKLIKEHCRKTKGTRNCVFSEYGQCEGPYKCKLGAKKYLPNDWEIPKPSRWTDADIALAKALIEFGVEKVKNFKDECAIIYESKDGTYPVKNALPKGAFSALNAYETVMLKDIVAEGENNG